MLLTGCTGGLAWLFWQNGIPLVAAHYPDFAEYLNARNYFGTAAVGNLDNGMDLVGMC